MVGGWWDRAMEMLEIQGDSDFELGDSLGGRGGRMVLLQSGGPVQEAEGIGYR